MATRLSIFLVCAVLLAIAQAIPLKPTDAQTCTELCSNCKGTATFVDDQCECNISENTDEGLECLSRMKRQAEERGLNLLSCDLSSDKRSTRCTLGLKHKFGKNNIDQVAKYFMEDGPITGNIFRAPPFTGKSSDCIGASRIITQPASTYQGQPQHYILTPQNYMDMPPLVSDPQQQYVSSPKSDCVGAQQQQMVSSPTPQQSNPVPPPPQVAMPSPPKQQMVSSPKSDCVGAPHQIITQPKETMPESKAMNQKEPANDASPSVGQASPKVGAPKVAAIKPLNIPGVTSFTPTLLHILDQQFSQPMLGIPQAISTISKTPGLSDLVRTPAQLLTSIVHRLGVPGMEAAQNLFPDIAKSAEDTVGMPNTQETKSADDCNPTVGSENPTSNMPTFTYMNPAYAPQIISLISPHVGAPAPGTLSYLNPTVGAPAPGTFSYTNPTVGAPAPTHVSYIHPLPAYTSIPMIPNTMMSSYVPHVPAATYIVGSPFSMPYYTTDASSMSMKEPDTTLEETFKYPSDQTVGSPKAPEVPVLQPQKKICKKSTKEEPTRKMTRDVKGVPEPITDEANQKQSQTVEAANKQDTQTPTGISKLDRSINQRSTIEKSTSQKVKIERSAAKADKSKSEVIGKIKLAKEITKKPKTDKKNVEQKATIRR